jgi:FkbM family methyltransferase
LNYKYTLRRWLNHAGFDVHLIDRGAGHIRTTHDELYAHLKRLGFQPAAVIDVGVASGTPDLYSAFPDAYFLLIEPLNVFESEMRSILKRHRGSYVLAAASSKAGHATFNVHDGNLTGSSLFKESRGKEADGYEISVPLVRIDDIVREKQLPGPYLIKADVQGAELDALEGGQQVLSGTDVVILEVSLFKFMKGAPQFYDVVVYMKKHGFAVYDIIPGWNRPLDNALGQVDIMFVREDGRFRKDHRYS